MIRNCKQFLWDCLGAVCFFLVVASLIAIGAIACRGGDDDMPTPLPVPDPISTPLIRFPMQPVSVVPDKPQLPIDTVTFDSTYVIESDVEVFFLTIPDGVVKLTDLRADLPDDMKTSPIVLRESFAGGDGTKELRILRAPFLYVVSAVKVGNTTLVNSPSGNTERARLTGLPLTVVGTSPRPGPDPKPDPNPDPTPTPTAEHVSLAIVQDTQNITQPTAAVLNALVGWSEFLDAGNEWRLYDIKTTELKGKAALADAGSTTLPAMIVRDRATGKLIKVVTLPLTFEEFKTTVGVEL